MDENIRRGGAVFHAQIPDEKFEAVSTALEEAGAVHFDEREAAWRREGWTGSSSAAATTTTGTTTSHTAPVDTTSRVGGTAGTEERIPLAEEQIVVGKREVSHGRVRVRSYVVETPVEEQVALREEHVDVERRPVNRAVQPNDDAFRDRVVEVTETAEEAVVSKSARVREEVVVHKDVEERVETVRDTVRRTEVEVERDADVRRAGTLEGQPPADTGVAHGTVGSTDGRLASHQPDGTPGNPPGTAASQAVDRSLGTNVSGAHPEHNNPDGTPGNPPGTMASRAVDKTLGTNVSGANPKGGKQ
ncbi:MAG: YsnF/AvaK domain-containing protein [Rhodopila sp.]